MTSEVIMRFDVGPGGVLYWEAAPGAEIVDFRNNRKAYESIHPNWTGLMPAKANLVRIDIVSNAMVPATIHILRENGLMLRGWASDPYISGQFQYDDGLIMTNPFADELPPMEVITMEDTREYLEAVTSLDTN